MAGAKQFDPEAVLSAAMRLFWRQGYDATSIQDLEAATGLGRGSLYNAFGDKETLFLKVLERYSAEFGAPPLRHLAKEDCNLGLRDTLQAQVDRLLDKTVPGGCLMINTILGREGTDRIGERVNGAVKGMKAAFRAAFQRAVAAGQLPANADIDALSTFYAATMASLAVLSKTGSSRDELENTARLSLATWTRWKEGNFS
jgi:TetR/AcrR family transcriptional repressor of nem operon